MSRASLRGVDLTRPMAEIIAETGATKQGVWIARKRAGLPCECPAKSSKKIGRSRRPRVERVAKVAPVVVEPVAVEPVAEVVWTGPALCRRRSFEEWCEPRRAER